MQQLLRLCAGHGASTLLWPPAPVSPPLSPTVIEFLFLADPPLMFWHAAGALGQSYWLLPVPQAYWMQEEMQVGRSCCFCRGWD